MKAFIVALTLVLCYTLTYYEGGRVRVCNVCQGTIICY